ncbi:MAG: stage II sporulation protein M [Planctomycetes bacterium]|nr:stage II sporulation protein M [Planctomycetota bacterium]
MDADDLSGRDGGRRNASGTPPLREAQGTRAAQLRRLDDLLARAGGRLSALSGDEVGELGRLYRAAATQLALARAGGASVAERERLNDLVGRAHGLIYGAASAAQQGAGARAWLVALLLAPVAVRRAWRYHLLAAALLLAGAAYGWVGAADDAEWALELVMQAGDERTPYATKDELLKTLRAGRPDDGEGGHGAGEKAVFAAFLWQNNTRVALLAFFAGPLAGVPTGAVLLFNGMVLGSYSHTFVSRGLAWEWWAWILPHGVTELLAIVLLAGGGLWLGRLMVAPGDRSRREALREARPDVLRLALLAFPMLLLAAALESFVRQSGLSEPGRYWFAAATAAFWALWLGWARPPRAWLAALAGGPATRAEGAVPAAAHDDLDDGLGGLEEALRAARSRR